MNLDKNKTSDPAMKERKMFAVLAAFLGLFAVTTVDDYLKQTQMLKVNGTVSGQEQETDISSIKNVPVPTLQYYIRYKYKVNGFEYEGRDMDASPVTTTHPLGSSIAVYVNPTDPAISTTDDPSKKNSTNMVSLALYLAVFIVGVCKVCFFPATK